MKPNKRGQEFKVLELKIKNDSVSPHVIYIKEHSVRDHSSDKPPGRTLLALNLPPYANKLGLTNAFSEVGNIINIIFTLSPGSMEDENAKKFLKENDITGFKLAFIIFEKVSDLDKALKLKSLQPMCNEIYEVKTGMSKWASEYNASIMSTSYLKECIENFMKQHDSETKISEKKEKDLGEEDNDGWMTVIKGGKIKSFARSEKVENKILAKEEQGKKRKELKNFYTFQIRESKMKHVVALRQKFEEDKKKINLIKQSRRFKPF